MVSRQRRDNPTPPPKRWECRYSSSEMMYLEMTATGVRSYLHHSPHSAEHTTFAQVMAGKLDSEVRNLFGQRALEELKAEVRKHLDADSGESA
jgi:hypothetical protein